MTSSPARSRAERLAARLPLLNKVPLHREGMLPSFLVVGTKRGGSSSLYDWICRHPAVGACRAGKGTHYFDVNYSRGWTWYRSQFPVAGDEQSVTGEASPYYMFHPTAPQRIAAALPDVRLVAVLRDPVERAWSQWRYERLRGHEPLDVEAALDAEPARLAGEEERLVAEPGYVSAAHRHHSYVRRGEYATQLRRLHGLVGTDRVLVLQSERLFADPVAELARVWDFLGLPRVRPEHLPTVKQGVWAPMPSEVRERLTAHFAPYNAELSTLPGVDVSWAPRPR